MAADKEAVGLSRVNMHESKCILPLHDVALRGVTAAFKYSNNMRQDTSVREKAVLRSQRRPRDPVL